MLSKSIFVISFTVISLLAQCQVDELSQYEYVHPIEADLERQFDFWIGQWDVDLFVYQEDSTWKKQHEAIANVYPILDGKAILELWNEKGESGIKGFSLRYYNHEKNRWELWLKWPRQNRSTMGYLEGEFKHGRGEFETSFKNAEGKDTKARYTFSDISPTSLRWDDTYSSDRGKTWSGNWIMELSRQGKNPEPFTDRIEAPTYETGGRCTGQEFDFYEDLTGTWEGSISTYSEGEKEKSIIDFHGYKILDGCATIFFYEYENLKGRLIKTFALASYNTNRQKYELLSLTNQASSQVRLFYGDSYERKVITKNDHYRVTFDSIGENSAFVKEEKKTKGKWELIYEMKLKKR